MSFIALSFSVDEDDVVAGAEAAALPVRGPSGRIYVLHDDGTVTQHPTAQQATYALQLGAELLLWWVAGNAVASKISRRETRLHVRLDLAGADAGEAAAVAEAVRVLLGSLRDVEIEALL